MNSLDKNIESVAFSKINKLDIRGGHLAARNHLISLLNNLPESSLVRDFILKLVNKEFELLASCSKGKLTINNSANIQTWLDVTASNFHKTKAGTYRFLQTQNGEMYIGSTGSFYDRILSHKQKFNSKSKKGIGPLHRSQLTQQNTLLFSIIHQVPNYIGLWILENPRYPLLQGEGELLYLLTYYPIRVLEQNLVDNFKPSINGGNVDNVIVTHSFTKTSPNAFNKLFKVAVAGKSINIFDRNLNLLFKAPS